MIKYGEIALMSHKVVRTTCTIFSIGQIKKCASCYFDVKRDHHLSHFIDVPDELIDAVHLGDLGPSSGVVSEFYRDNNSSLNDSYGSIEDHSERKYT